MNQCIKVPSGGIILGYFFFFCAANSSADKLGPGYRGASLRSRAPCDGGVNLDGFSRTRGFELFLGALCEALRIVRAVDVDVERRVRHNALPWGKRNRGIVVGGILGETRDGARSMRPTNRNISYGDLQRADLDASNSVPYFAACVADAFSNIPPFIGWTSLRCGSACLQPALILSFSPTFQELFLSH
jgi:hypothetical protein